MPSIQRLVRPQPQSQRSVTFSAWLFQRVRSSYSHTFESVLLVPDLVSSRTFSEQKSCFLELNKHFVCTSVGTFQALKANGGSFRGGWTRTSSEWIYKYGGFCGCLPRDRQWCALWKLSKWIDLCHYTLVFTSVLLTVVPGRAGGGSFRGRRTCKPNKDFANRMHAGQPASAIPKPNFGALRRSVLWCFSGG